MALAKDNHQLINHVYSYYETDNFVGSSSAHQGLSDQSSPGLHEEQPRRLFEEGDSSSKNVAISSTSSSSRSTNSAGFVYHQAMKYQVADDCNSVISFKSGYTNSIGSLLSFEQHHVHFQEDFSMWENNHHHHHNDEDDDNNNNSNNNNNYTMSNNNVCPSYHGTQQFTYKMRENSRRGINTQKATNTTSSGACLNKRPSYMEVEGSQPHNKRQCTISGEVQKHGKPKTSPSKDPQSIAAKNRRERISERLKILQELVPNGSKVDLVTMLEKAISYVKFLQLQVKVLATDEFWPAQGGKVPDLCQVKEAIDAILASQRNKNSSTSNE